MILFEFGFSLWVKQATGAGLDYKNQPPSSYIKIFLHISNGIEIHINHVKILDVSSLESCDSVTYRYHYPGPDHCSPSLNINARNAQLENWKHSLSYQKTF